MFMSQTEYFYRKFSKTPTFCDLICYSRNNYFALSLLAIIEYINYCEDL